MFRLTVPLYWLAPVPTAATWAPPAVAAPEPPLAVMPLGYVVDQLDLVQLLARDGVGDDAQSARGDAVVLGAGDDGLVGEYGLAVGGPDDLAGGVAGGGGTRGLRGLGGLDRGGGGGGRGLLRRERGDLDSRLDGLGHVLHGAVGGTVDDEIAAEDRKTGVGALVACMDRAVGVLDDVLDDQLLLRAEAERLGGGRDGGAVVVLRGGTRRCGGGTGGEQGAGEDGRAGREGETARSAVGGGKRGHGDSPERHGELGGIATQPFKEGLP